VQRVLSLNAWVIVAEKRDTPSFDRPSHGRFGEYRDIEDSNLPPSRYDSATLVLGLLRRSADRDLIERYIDSLIVKARALKSASFLQVRRRQRSPASTIRRLRRGEPAQANPAPVRISRVAATTGGSERS
jgi:hypothetical protein